MKPSKVSSRSVPSCVVQTDNNLDVANRRGSPHVAISPTVFPRTSHSGAGLPALTRITFSSVFGIGSARIARDNKTQRGSYDRTNGKTAPHQRMGKHDWADRGARWRGKSNEITAILQLLALLDLRGSTVNTPAIATQIIAVGI